jgi:cytochrome c oxidase subunit 3
MKREKTTRQQTGYTGFTAFQKLHPYKIFLFFTLLASSLLFLTISFLFLTNLTRQTPLENFVLSRWFFAASVSLMLSSYSLIGIKNAFENDDALGLRQKFILTILGGMAFLICQILGWKEMMQAGHHVNSHPLTSFFYLLSAIHFIHALIGVLLLGGMTVYLAVQSRDAVKRLLYFSNKINLVRLELSAIFWHFVDFLWVGLFLMFVFTLG